MSEFFKPKTVKECIDLLDQYGSKAMIVNGGTDAVEKINTGKAQPEAVILMTEMKELKKITVKDGAVHVGGAVTYLQMLKNAEIKKNQGMMIAVGAIGSPPVRVMATPAGNVGTAAPSADCTTMLMGSDAKIHVVSKKEGERVIPIDKFFVKTYVNVLKPEDLITEVEFPAMQPGMGSGYVRLTRRKVQDIGKVLVSATIEVKRGRCTKAVIGLGALNATAVRAYSVEEALVGLSRKEAQEFCRSGLPKEAGLRPSRYTHYKEITTPVALERAVMMAWDQAEGKVK
ncbi:MAG: FAD binding domain-containing protein [Lachnospiraceae bacterium]|nr:FAD binding domain-containing protein [Lachnospiraceae bacterium]